MYSLAGKGPSFVRLAEHPRVTALLDRILAPNYLLSTMQSIRLHPGERAQPWHTDVAFYVSPRPREQSLAASVIWAIEDFTRENGATELLRGSHRWGMEHPDESGLAPEPAVMPAGSALVFGHHAGIAAGRTPPAARASRSAPSTASRTSGRRSRSS